MNKLNILLQHNELTHNVWYSWKWSDRAFYLFQRLG